MSTPMGVSDRLSCLGSLECFGVFFVYQQVIFTNHYFQWGHMVDFFGGHCSSCLFGELGLNNHYDNF